jgi:hypothetical protein
MGLHEGDKIASIAKVAKEEGDETPAGAEPTQEPPTETPPETGE